MDFDGTTVLFLIAGLLAAADRGVAVIERFGGRVRGLRGWDRKRAREIVEREQRDEALASLAERANQILAAVGQNGKPLHDRVSEVQSDLAAVHRRLERGDERMGRIEGRLGAIEERRTA